MSGVLTARWTTVQGVPVFARTGGVRPRHPGPVIVLVHGQVISSRYMVPTARRLAPYFPVLAPDLPGFGRSGKPRRVLSVPQLADALGAWMDVIGLRSAALVANSLGCQIVVDLAARRPELACALVLAGPTIDRHARHAPTQVVRWLRDAPRERPSLMLAHLGDFMRAGVRRSLGTFRCTLADRIEDKLPRVTAPTLVVRGERDPIVPQRWTEEVTALLPDGRLAVIRRGPHCVNYSTPRTFARLVRAFVRPTGVTVPLA